MRKIFQLLIVAVVFSQTARSETSQIVANDLSATDVFCSCSNKRGQASAAQCPKGKSLGCLLRPVAPPDTPQGWCYAECYNEKGEKEIGKKIPCPFNNGEGDCSIIGQKSLASPDATKPDF